MSSLLCNKESEVELIIHACTDEQSARYGIDIVKKYDNYYTSIGFHPEGCDRLPANYIEILEGLLPLSDKIVAVGEIGLDYHYDGFDKKLQIKLFCDQLEFAKKYNLPVIMHCRDATADFLNILQEYKPEGVVHCFTGSPEVAREIVDLGLYVGFTGILTFKNSKKVKRSFEEVPVEKILLETDCPYMAPEPNRGKRCTSDMIKYIAEFGAEIKGLAPQEFVNITNYNAKKLFNIKK